MRCDSIRRHSSLSRFTRSSFLLVQEDSTDRCPLRVSSHPLPLFLNHPHRIQRYPCFPLLLQRWRCICHDGNSPRRRACGISTVTTYDGVSIDCRFVWRDKVQCPLLRFFKFLNQRRWMGALANTRWFVS